METIQQAEAIRTPRDACDQGLVLIQQVVAGDEIIDQGADIHGSSIIAFGFSKPFSTYSAPMRPFVAYGIIAAWSPTPH
ncbi:MAG: hypothetical protein PVI78_02075, partial [Anaerolineales bacterium]|jgi:hypothetical protein